MSIDTHFLDPLRWRNFRLLWTGAFISSIGTFTQDLALAWLIHSELREPIYLGLRAFAAEAPLIALMLVGGALADRFDRRRILLASQIAQMSFAAALALLYFSGSLGLMAILLLAFLTGLAQSQSAPTYQAALTSLVPRELIPGAVALNSFQFNLSRMLGPALAGVVLAHAGIGFCFSINVLSFAFVIVALIRLDMPSPVETSGESLAASLEAGLAHVWNDPVLRRLTLLAAVSSFLAFPLTTYLPVIADDVHGGGATGFSVLAGAFGVGTIAGALQTAQRGAASGRGRLMLRAMVGFAAAALAALFAPGLWLAAAALVAAGWSLVTAYSTLNALVQEHAVDALRGRILSIYGLAFRGGMPLGGLAAGWLIGRTSAPATLSAFFVSLAIVAVVVGLSSRRLGRL